MQLRQTLDLSIGLGAIGFGAASLLVFATVAYAERWMYATLGLSGAYLAWIVMFIALGSGALLPVVAGPFRRRFPGLFALAFFVYGVSWYGLYVALKGRPGEIAAAVVAPVLMTVVFAAGFRATNRFPGAAAWLLVGNAVAYFGGSGVNDELGRGPTGMLAWGAVYGVFLGAGLGGALYVFGNPTGGRRALTE